MKVYGKPPLPPPGKVKSLKLNATGRTTMSGLGGQRRATSLADISQSPSTTAPFSVRYCHSFPFTLRSFIIDLTCRFNLFLSLLSFQEAGQVDSRRKQSAPAILSCVVKANAKVIHHPKPKPRSASTLPTRRTSGTPAQPHHHHSLSNSSNSTPSHKSYAQLGTVTGTRLTGTRSLDRPSPSPEFLRPMSLELREEGDDDVLELDSPPPPPFLGRAKLGLRMNFFCQSRMSSAGKCSPSAKVVSSRPKPNSLHPISLLQNMEGWGMGSTWTSAGSHSRPFPASPSSVPWSQHPSQRPEQLRHRIQHSQLLYPSPPVKS